MTDPNPTHAQEVADIEAMVEGLWKAPEVGKRMIWPDCERSLSAAVGRWGSFSLPTLRQGQTVDHLCGDQQCLNPDHMRLVKPSENRGRSGFVRGAGR